jgi:aromatic-L-amino-acid decarboxylase
MDYGAALGRRFRSLKLWFVLRYYGTEGVAARLREHIRLASWLAAEIDKRADFERVAPQQFSTVVFRYRPEGLNAAELDALNEKIVHRVNASGEIFISHTMAKGRYALRVALGNVRTEKRDAARAWELIQEAARAG